MSKSHILPTKKLLKRFSHRNNKEFKGKIIKGAEKVWCLHIKDKKIEEVRINDYGTEVDFFNTRDETYLCEIESAFGRVNKKIITTKNINEYGMVLEKQDIEDLKKFIYYLQLRSYDNLDVVNNHFKATKQIKRYKQEDLFRMDIFYPDASIFKNLQIKVIYNTSDVEFVLPKSCFYAYRPWIGFILPFTPNCAYLFHDKKYSVINKNKEESYMLNIEHNDIIIAFNKTALEMEKFDNIYRKDGVYKREDGSVIARKKAELEYLLNLLH